MAVEFHDFSMEVKAALDDAVKAYLYEAGGELTSQVSNNSRVGSGELKNSWTYKVEEEKGICTVGSPLENAIWEEFGTGEYALNGDGRKTPWIYKDRYGVWHKTTGKYPKRAFQKAFTRLKPKLIERLATILSKGFK